MVRLLQGDCYNIIILYHHMYMYIHVAVIITIYVIHTHTHTHTHTRTHTHTSAITGTLEVGSSGSTIITVLGCMERFLCQGEGTDINWRFFGTRIDVTNTSSRQITVSSLSLSSPPPHHTTPHHTTHSHPLSYISSTWLLSLLYIYLLSLGRLSLTPWLPDLNVGKATIEQLRSLLYNSIVHLGYSTSQLLLMQQFVSR